MQAGLGLTAVFGEVTASPVTTWPEAPADARPWLELTLSDSGSEDSGPDGDALARDGWGGLVFPAMGSDASAWQQQARAAAAEAQRGGLGFDLRLNALPRPATALDELRSEVLEPFSDRIQGGQEVSLSLPDRTFETLGAWPHQGAPMDLTPYLGEDGTLAWPAPVGDWRVFGLGTRKAGEELDPFSAYAMTLWLDFQEKPLEAEGLLPPRAKVFERTAATEGSWSPALLDAFQKLRGYDLREQLPALFGQGDPGNSLRVVSDYRETLGEMHLDALDAWRLRTQEEGALSRSVLRGNPGNPIDLQAIADIPGVLDPADPPFAASAAHFALKPLITGVVVGGLTSSPNEIRRRCEALWLRGANQLEFPPIDPALHLGIPALTDWVTRIQTILQSGAPDPDLLLYYPYHDFLATRGGLPHDPDERLLWMASSGFGHAMQALDEAGISYDIVSDRLLASATASESGIILGGLLYQAIMLPEVERLPETTAILLRDLSRRGGKIGILGDWPTDVPGYPAPDIRRGTLVQALEDIHRSEEDDDPVRLAEKLGIRGESFAAAGLRGIRRHHADGHHYWLLNPTDKVVDTEVELSRPASALVLLDPAIPDRAGTVATESTEYGRIRFPLRLEPHESRLIRTFRQPLESPPRWPQRLPGIDLRGLWTLTFQDGGQLELPLLGSWRTLADPQWALTTDPVRYHLDFELPDGADRWLLDFGKVSQTGSVKIDGEPIGTLFGNPAALALPVLAAGSHHLEVVVSATSQSSEAGLLGPVRAVPLTASSEE
ncbi:hypothetical protein [Haloferula luteola]|uniref:hypothetical protein n=1 Tax=Haloferula luteola TaxID=595692 RepID=UPI00160DB930|nr:hypothetical protein [Haloferula luteola]